MAGLVLTPWVGSANLFALLVLAFTRGAGGVEVSAGALILAAGVGSTGPLFMGGRREGVRLGVAIGLHRLLVAVVCFPLVFFKPDPILLHVGYHLFALVLYLPLHPFWEKFAMRLVPEFYVAPKYLRLEALSSPGFAKALALMELSRVGDVVLRMLRRSIQALAQDQGSEKELDPLEEKVDLLSREILLYAAALDGRDAFPLLTATSEMEHLGDLAKRFLRKVERLWAQGLTFSNEGQRQLVEAARLILARLELLNAALATGQPSLAEEVLKGRVQIEARMADLRLAHLDRLRAGKRESQASTLTHLDLLIVLDELDRGMTHIAGLIPEFRRSIDPGF
ncbi:PhoU domain-containing protein [Thermus scotoductus]|nr:PhoU domain-containing protein [Thermus scotoductus]